MEDRAAPAEPRRRRRRRTQAEVIQRVLDAARAQFSDRGYAASTTRDIARRADVSETLLFRYFKSKSALYDQVVFEPFDAIVDAFLASDPVQDGAPDSHSLQDLLSFLDLNRQVLMTLAVKGLADNQDERAAYRTARLQRHYARAAERIGEQHAAAGSEPATPPELSVRLAFGMLLASSLFADWLFPEGEPDRAQLIAGIEQMLLGALSPPEHG